MNAGKSFKALGPPVSHVGSSLTPEIRSTQHAMIALPLTDLSRQISNFFKWRNSILLWK